MQEEAIRRLVPAVSRVIIFAALLTLTIFLPTKASAVVGDITFTGDGPGPTTITITNETTGESVTGERTIAGAPVVIPLEARNWVPGIYKVTFTDPNSGRSITTRIPLKDGRNNVDLAILLSTASHSSQRQYSPTSSPPLSVSAEEGLPPPPIPESYRRIIERQQRDAQREEEAKGAGGTESEAQDAWQQFTTAAKDLEKAAIDDLRDAIKAAKDAGAGDPKDGDGRTAKAQRAQDKAIEAMNKFEAAQRNAKQAAGWAEDLKKSGVTLPETPYAEDGYKKAIADLRPPKEGPAQPQPNTGGGPELEPYEEMSQSAAELEKAAVDELEEAATAAKEAGALDPKNVDGRSTKARVARDHAINAMRNFESGQRFARSAEQLRQRAAVEKKAEEKKSSFWESLVPALIPSIGIGGRDDDRRERSDPWPGRR